MNIWVPNALVNDPNFQNIEPNDLGFGSWKSSRIHKQNIVLVYWTIQCRKQADGELVSISSKKLQKRGGRYCSRYLDWLIRHGFIEQNRQYHVGKSSRKYRTTTTGDSAFFSVSKLKALRFSVQPEMLTELERLTFQKLHELDFNSHIATEAFEALSNAAKPGANHSIIKFTLKDFRPHESTSSVLKNERAH